MQTERARCADLLKNINSSTHNKHSKASSWNSHSFRNLRARGFLPVEGCRAQGSVLICKALTALETLGRKSPQCGQKTPLRLNIKRVY